MSQQPTLNLEGPGPHDTDDTGKKWIQALVGNDMKILAGRDDLGNFHCYVDAETLFDNAMTTILHAQGVEIESGEAHG